MPFDNIITREKTRMPSISQAGRETEKMVLPADAKFVTLDEALEYGYHGITPDTTPRDEYTFAGAAKRVPKHTAAPGGTSSTSATSTTPAAKSARSADK